MATRLTAEHARETLTAHVAAKGAEIHARYGPHIGYAELQAILQDRACVRYPCELVFDASALQAGEPAHAEPRGETPEEGFRLLVHPLYLTQPADVPLLALYQIVAVNYGEFASPDDAETFAAHALGLPIEEYYARLCALADQLGEPGDPGPSSSGGCGCGCS